MSLSDLSHTSGESFEEKLQATHQATGAPPPHTPPSEHDQQLVQLALKQLSETERSFLHTQMAHFHAKQVEPTHELLALSHVLGLDQQNTISILKSPKLLQQMVQEAFLLVQPATVQLQLRSQVDRLARLYLKQQARAHVAGVSFDARHFLVKLTVATSERLSQVKLIAFGSLLGSGAFASVYERKKSWTTLPSASKKQVIKTFRAPGPQEGGFGEAHRSQEYKTGLMREYEVLRLLNPSANAVGIQSPIHYLLKGLGTQNSEMAYVAEAASGTLSSEIQKLTNSLELLQQTATGLIHTHDMGVYHGDIKPDNILLLQPQPHDQQTPRSDDPKEALSPRFQFCDWGGAEYKSAIASFLQRPTSSMGRAFILMGTYTEEYCSNADERALKEAIDSYDEAPADEKEDAIEKVWQILQARDIYAWALSMLQVHSQETGDPLALLKLTPDAIQEQVTLGLKKRLPLDKHPFAETLAKKLGELITSPAQERLELFYKLSELLQQNSDERAGPSPTPPGS